MAYSTDDEQEQSGQPGDQPGMQTNGASTLSENIAPPVSGSGSNPILGESNGPVYGSGTSGKGTSSGQFINLQSYLKAGADQNPFTGITANINTEGSKASSDLNGAENTFNTDVQNGGVNYDQSKSLVDQALQDPTKFSQDPGNVSAFQKIYGASYSGPTSLNDVSGFNAGEGADVSGQVQGLGTEGGRLAELQQYAQTNGQGPYSYGESTLDNALGASNPATPQLISSLQGQYGNLGTDYSNALTNSFQTASQAKTDTSNAAGYAQKGISGAVSGLQSDVDAATKTAADNAAKTWGTLTSDLKSNQLTPTDLQYLNGTTMGEHLYGVDPMQYLTQNAPPTAANVITSDQLAKMGALAKLSGNPASNIYANISAPQSYSPAQFDSSAFQSAIDKGAAAYNTDLNSNMVTPIEVVQQAGASPGTVGPQQISTVSQMQLPQAISFLQNQIAQNPNTEYMPQLQSMLTDYQNRLSGIQSHDKYNSVLGNTAPQGSNPTVPRTFYAPSNS